MDVEQEQPKLLLTQVLEAEVVIVQLIVLLDQEHQDRQHQDHQDQLHVLDHGLLIVHHLDVLQEAGLWVVKWLSLNHREA